MGVSRQNGFSGCLRYLPFAGLNKNGSVVHNKRIAYRRRGCFLQTCSALSAPVYTFIPGYALPIEGCGMVMGGLMEKELLRQAELLCADGKGRSREGI